MFYALLSIISTIIHVTGFDKSQLPHTQQQYTLHGHTELYSFTNSSGN